MAELVERSPDIALYPEERLRPGSEHLWDLITYWWARPLIDMTHVTFVPHNVAELYRVADSGARTFLFSNHISWADHFLIFYFVIQNKPFRVAAITKEKYYKWPFSREILRFTNQVPVTNIKITFARWFHEQHGRVPTEADFVAFMDEAARDSDHEVNRRKSAAMLKTAEGTRTMLDRGRIILGYPEGTRSKTGRLQATKTGIMQLPLMFKGTIVPTGVWGTEKILSRANGAFDFIRFFFWKGPEVHCAFGPGLPWDEALGLVEDKFTAAEDPVNLQRVRSLRDEIVTGAFQAFSAEANRYERVFDEVALLVMRRINALLPDEYRAAEAVEVKYSRSV